MILGSKHVQAILSVLMWNFMYVQSHKCDFSKDQRSSLKMILGSKHIGAILSVLMWNFMYVHYLVY